MTAVTVTVRVVSDDAVPVPIDGINVRSYTNPGDSFVTEGTTGVPNPTTGEAEITLDGDVVGIGYLLRFFKTGVSFQGSTFPIVVTDPPSPPNTFEFSAHEGETALIVQFSVKDDQPTPAAVEGMTIRVYDNVDSFLTEIVTDSNGVVDLALVGDPDPGRSHIVRLAKATYVIEDGPTKTLLVLDPLVPPATNIFDFTAAIPPTKVSSDPDMCLMSGYLVDSSLAPVKGLNIRFIPREGYPHDAVSGLPFTSEPTIVRDRGIVRDVIAQTEEDGYIEVALPRGGVFDVSIHGLEIPGDQVISPIYIPDIAGIDILKVLWPYISEVVYSPTDLTMSVDDVEEVEPTITTSNLQTLDSTRYNSLLLFEVADPSVAELTVTAEGNLSIMALASGSTTIEVSRVEGTVAPHRPSLSAIISTPPTITVT